MAIEHLKRATKTAEVETDTARAVVADMLAEIERRGEAAVRDYAAKLDRWSGEIVVTARGHRPAHARHPRRRQARHRVGDGAGAHLCARPARQHQGLRHRVVRRRHGGSAARALQCRRLLRADRALRSHRLGLHVGRHRQGGGRQDGCRLLDALSRRGHPPARALCHAHRRRRRDHDARRRAGDRRAGVRTVHRQACRHRGRPGQQVRGRGQARALRQGRHRRVRGPDRDRYHRRRQRRSCVWLRPTSSVRPSTGTRARRG